MAQQRTDTGNLKATEAPSRVEAAGTCASDARWGSAPQALPADTRAKRLADHLTLRNIPMSKAYAAVFAVGLAGSFIASVMQLRSGLAVFGVTGLLVGGYCSVNFWRCRHAHCLVTGPGYLAYSALAFVEAGIGRSVIGGYEALLFLVVFLVAVTFEALWRARRGSNAIASPDAPTDRSTR
ncbi:MAG: hypothetical protein ACRDRL_18950 [Sciscionella sp.]